MAKSNNPNLKEVSKATQFSSTNQPENKRRPNRFKHLKDSFDLTNEDVSSLISHLLSLKLSELNKIILNKDTTMLEKAFARAVKEAAQKGTLFQLEKLLERKIGKVANSIDLTTGGDPLPIAINVNPVKVKKEDE